MTIEELRKVLELDENEHLEFKEAKSSFSILGNDGRNKNSVLGYCVAIGNEGGGKLILGVSDKIPKKIVGSQSIPNLSEAKAQIYNSIEMRIEIYEIFDEQKNRVVIIEIPSRKKGVPLKFYGIPLMRIGEELTEMDETTESKIRQEIRPDWSGEICANATIDNLDPKAIITAKENFKRKNPTLSKEIDQWDTITFLNKAKLTIQGKVTNTAIILLGKKESAALLSPAVVQITWILKDDKNDEKDYTHFSCPFLLSIEDVYNKIRNLKYRYIKDDTLFPEEVDSYDPYVIREALNNCIAHQDYSLHGRIHVIEKENDYLVFTNKGAFLPGTIEEVIEADSPQEYYKNKFLVDAMVNLNMIDTIGSGIKRMFKLQKEKYFPMPSYEIYEEKVSVTIYGKVLDINYARTLAHHKNLTLLEIILLDQIQKGKIISKASAKKLKNKLLIEGRYPNLYISEQIAETTGNMVQYIKNRGFHNTHYKKMIVEYLKKEIYATRRDMDDLLVSMLPNILTEKQKKKRVGNLLVDMSKKDKTIINKGTNKNPKWVLTDSQTSQS